MVDKVDIHELSVVDDNNQGQWTEGGTRVSDLNNAGRADQGTIARWFADTNGSKSFGGTAAALTFTSDTQPTAYYAGFRICGIVTAANDAGATMNVDALGAVPILDINGNPVLAGALPLGARVDLIHDGTGNFVALSVAKLTADPITIGYHSMPLLAGGWEPALTNGSSYKNADEVSGAAVMVPYLSFSDDVRRYAQITVAMPKSADITGTLQGRIYCKAPGNTANVVLKLQSQARGDGDAFNSSWGGEITLTEATLGGGTSMSVYEFSGLTPAGPWAANDQMILRLSRDPTDAGDTLSGDWHFIEMQLDVPINGANDD